MGNGLSTNSTQTDNGLSLGSGISDAVAAFLEVVDTQNTIEEGIEELIRQTKIEIEKKLREQEQLLGEANRQTQSLQSQVNSLMPNAGTVTTPVIPSSLQ